MLCTSYHIIYRPSGSATVYEEWGSEKNLLDSDGGAFDYAEEVHGDNIFVDRADEVLKDAVCVVAEDFTSSVLNLESARSLLDEELKMWKNALGKDFIGIPLNELYVAQWFDNEERERYMLINKDPVQLIRDVYKHICPDADFSIEIVCH